MSFLENLAFGVTQNIIKRNWDIFFIMAPERLALLILAALAAHMMYRKTVGENRSLYIYWTAIYIAAFSISSWSSTSADLAYNMFVKFRATIETDLIFTKPPFYFLLGQLADLIGGKALAKIALMFASPVSGFGIIYLLEKAGQRRLATMYAFIPLAIIANFHQTVGFLLLLCYLTLQKKQFVLGGLVGACAAFVHFSALPLLIFILANQAMKGSKYKNIAGGISMFLAASYLFGYNTISYGLEVLRRLNKYVSQYIKDPLKERLLAPIDFVLLTGPASFSFFRASIANWEMRLLAIILVLTAVLTSTPDLIYYSAGYVPLLLIVSKDNITDQTLRNQGIYFAIMFVLLRIYG